MGLSIGKHYGYSYSTLHRLREFALKVEGNKRKLSCGFGKPCGKCVYCMSSNDNIRKPRVTKFPEFVLHCDCGGDYKPGVKPSTVYHGNLDKLKEELRILRKQLKKTYIDPWLKKPFLDFYKDVMVEDEVVKFG